MDSEIPNTRMRGRRSQGKISLEDYLDFVESHNQINLTVNYLNQIVAMHGFLKLKEAPKKGVVEAVNSINLMNPLRSTLNENISSNAFITIEEVIADLKDLNWTECRVSSIQIINSLSTDHGQLLLLGTSEEQSISKEISIAVDDSNVSYDGFSNSNSTGSSNGKRRSATKLKTKRKRIRTLREICYEKN